MTLAEYMETHNELKQLFFYMLDAQEWVYLSDNEEQTPVVTDYKKGLLSKAKPSFVVYVDKQGLREYATSIQYTNLIVMRPKPALKYLLDQLDAGGVEGVWFNRCLFVTVEEIRKAYDEYLFDYYVMVRSMLHHIEDLEMQSFQYLRALFSLPRLYILKVRDGASAEPGLLMLKTATDGGTPQNTAFLFDFRETAERYLQEMRMVSLEFVEIAEVETDHLISDDFKGLKGLVRINGAATIKLRDLEKLERKIVAVE
jgi:hypothetical protein